MQFEMKMPDLATTESQIKIVRWIVEVGQRVERGQPLLEIETDKATMEVESIVSGIVQVHVARAGEAVSVGKVVAMLDVEGVAPTPTTAAPKAPVGGMFARNRRDAAASKQVSGPAVSSSPVNEILLTVAQRTAGQRLQQSKQTVPHFYLQVSVNAAAMIAVRKSAAPIKPAWDAFFVYAAAKALRRFDRLAKRLQGDRLVAQEGGAIGVAVDIDGDLYVVPVGSAADKTITQISAEIRNTVERLKAGDADAKRIHPTIFTISNLGSSNVERFLPIINPPEAAILGIGKVMPVVVASEDGTITVQHRAALTLAVDHRVVSGKYAGDFLGAIVQHLETLTQANR